MSDPDRDELSADAPAAGGANYEQQPEDEEANEDATRTVERIERHDSTRRD